MTTYTIANRASGQVLGDYGAETVDAAILAMTREAGYPSIEEAATTLGISAADYTADLIVTEAPTPEQIAAVMRAMGKRRSAAKAAASKENGKKGGRPPKTKNPA